MRLATVKQSQEIDELSQKVYALTGEVLMEAAGSLACRELLQSYFPEISRGTVSVICGPGNNGGDGLVLARHLHSAGERDLIVFTTNSQQGSALYKLQLKRVEASGIKVIDLQEHPEKSEQLRSSELIVDAVFGIGLNKKVEGNYQKLFDVINSIKCPIVSLDTPSGLNCDRGTVDGAVVQADMTISFGLAKPGFFVADGPRLVGKLRVLPIGFPFEALRGVATTHFLFNEKLARRYLRNRKDTTNKSDYGHLVVAAGQKGMWGAGVLSSTSAYRMGVGYVTWASFQSPASELVQIPEVLTAELQDDKLLTNERVTAWAVGPGLGVTEQTAQLIEKLKEKNIKQVVIDADAITTCLQYNLFPLPKEWVITPHSGELSRVIHKDAKEIEQDRFACALLASEKMGCHVLLKGYRSVIAYGDRCMVINSGNSALAKAGTGDVLTGMIGALMAQGLDTLQATATAAYIHGRMADEWVRVGNSKSALSASDLAQHLPQLISRLAGGSLL